MSDSNANLLNQTYTASRNRTPTDDERARHIEKLQKESAEAADSQKQELNRQWELEG